MRANGTERLSGILLRLTGEKSRTAFTARVCEGGHLSDGAGIVIPCGDYAVCRGAGTLAEGDAVLCVWTDFGAVVIDRVDGRNL